MGCCNGFATPFFEELLWLTTLLTKTQLLQFWSPCQRANKAIVQPMGVKREHILAGAILNNKTIDKFRDERDALADDWEERGEHFTAA